MEVVGDYQKDGFAHIRGLIPAEVARAFMVGLKQDLGPGSIPVSRIPDNSPILNRSAFEIYGHAYKPMNYFLWALTPTIKRLVGRELLPTYDYFRIYREGDICRVHSDRPSCEHSVSLTLDYSDGQVWDLQVARDRIDKPHPVQDDFQDADFVSIGMQVGDAVLYQGVHHGHGRIKPNPNAWSAHLFLHFVDRDGPFAHRAFDKKVSLDPVNFTFA